VSHHRAIDDNFVKAIMTGLLRYDNSPGTEVPQIQLAARLRNYLWTGGEMSLVENSWRRCAPRHRAPAIQQRVRESGSDSRAQVSPAAYGASDRRMVRRRRPARCGGNSRS